MAPDAKVKVCSRPGCMVIIKPGQLACREHWFELTPRLREKLIFGWEQRKAHPDIPELVHIHRALLLEALREWGIPPEVVAMSLQMAPQARPTACPWCGQVGTHLDDCNRPS